MYHAHWGLDRSPFARGPAPAAFFDGESESEAQARLRFIVRQRQNALVLGERGVGKSLLVERFAAACRREGRLAAAINLGGLTPREFLWQAAAQWAIGPRPDEDAPRLFRRLADFAASANWRRDTAVLLCDDVDHAGPDVRVQLVRLLALSGNSPWLALAVTAVPQNGPRLGESLLEAIDLQIELSPWSEAETVGYIQHSLFEAGAERPIFDDEALAALYQLTDGVPRRVNRLADHALLGGAAEGLDVVDARMIEAASEAINWTATA